MTQRFLLLIVSIVLLCFAPQRIHAQCNSMPTTAAELSTCNMTIAQRFAPVHLQWINDDGGHAHDGKSDYLTKIDYDGDWVCHNNWENLNENSNLQYRAYVYYSVVWTKTHWYIIYAYYHPRDWAQSIFGNEHENDLEGILVVVRRDGENVINLSTSVLEAGITVFHSDFYSYIAAGSSFTEGNESEDGTLLTVDGTHPMTVQESEGHGCKAWPKIFEITDGLVTYVSNVANVAEFPSSINDSEVKYALVDIFESGGMWARRNDWPTFAEWGKFNGDNGAGSHKANPPWAWDDSNDGPTYSGEFAEDPENLVDHYFNSSFPISDCYQFLPYDCDYSATASQSSICSNKEVVLSVNRANGLPINSSSIYWNYSTTYWECVSGCGNNDPTITLKAKSNLPGSTWIQVSVTNIECENYYKYIVIDPGNNCAVPAFHFENSTGASQTTFCPGEDIYMDGSASQNETSFYIDTWRRPIGSTGSFSWYSGPGWTQGQIGTINLSQAIAPIEFTPGYEYEVKLAVNNATTGWADITHRFTVLASCCKTPINVQYSCKYGRIDWDVSYAGYYPEKFWVRVSWDDPTCCDPNPDAKSNQWMTTNEFFYLPFIYESNCFSYMVGADCGDGNINWSKKKCSDCKKLDGLLFKEQQVEATIEPELYPNPTQGMVNLSLEVEKDLLISVEAYDMQGRLIERLAEQHIPDGKFNTQLELDASLPRGVYLILLKTNYGLFQKKLVLQ